MSGDKHMFHFHSLEVIYLGTCALLNMGEALGTRTNR